MSNEAFDAPVFIEDGPYIDLLPREYPFLYNDHGHGRQLRKVFGTEISIAKDNPDLDRGVKYKGISHQPKTIPNDGHPYQITEFDFKSDEVHYEAIAATRESVQAFGMTLLKSGECLRFEYEGMIMAQYTYGKWAGHQSPYIGQRRRRELLTHNPTDLEFHDFPHVFFSQDDRPLVISVARWRPYVQEISLADLWIAPGDAIVVPPKTRPAAPSKELPEHLARRIIIDLHGNRNSALACWGSDKPALTTTTVLGNSQTMQTRAPNYHEELRPSTHPALRL
ncbi:hypothetical protein [Undibacterium pigrum]|uniref:Uncharacterized protein n=1 Tax=Undibacterium pigrum TaxID=401470 RepID=A0A318IRS0_9BURK|nr:hypothetical protein [Undibacterium pigrum]PXX37864.1 hypothetical protein DFR42_11423 [Undibacterium pigrum]